MGKVFIIAEAGVNHNGDIELAKKMIDVAIEFKCDAVKFHAARADSLLIKTAKKAEYQINNTGNSESQYEMLKKLELSYENNVELIKYCKNKGILFFSSPFHEDAADMLEKLGMELFKIPSGEITNMPFLKHVARKKKPIILSTGMSTLGEVEEALNWIYEESNYDVTLLHCTSNYPANVANVNLKAMLTMKNAFNVKVGYSDHTQGIEIPIAAVALGAEVIEKHFTVDKNFVGPDHKASLEPNELKLLVQSIRNVELAMGDGIKKPTPSEKDTAEVARKSIVSKVDIPAGTKITENMVCVKRPGIGIQPKYIDFVIGRKAIRNIKADELIEFKDIS